MRPIPIASTPAPVPPQNVSSSCPAETGQKSHAETVEKKPPIKIIKTDLKSLSPFLNGKINSSKENPLPKLKKVGKIEHSKSALSLKLPKSEPSTIVNGKSPAAEPSANGKSETNPKSEPNPKILKSALKSEPVYPFLPKLEVSNTKTELTPTLNKEALKNGAEIKTICVTELGSDLNRTELQTTLNKISKSASSPSSNANLKINGTEINGTANKIQNDASSTTEPQKIDEIKPEVKASLKCETKTSPTSEVLKVNGIKSESQCSEASKINDTGLNMEALKMNAVKLKSLKAESSKSNVEESGSKTSNVLATKSYEVESVVSALEASKLNEIKLRVKISHANGVKSEPLTLEASNAKPNAVPSAKDTSKTSDVKYSASLLETLKKTDVKLSNGVTSTLETSKINAIKSKSSAEEASKTNEIKSEVTQSETSKTSANVAKSNSSVKIDTKSNLTKEQTKTLSLLSSLVKEAPKTVNDDKELPKLVGNCDKNTVEKSITKPDESKTVLSSDIKTRGTQPLLNGSIKANTIDLKTFGPFAKNTETKDNGVILKMNGSQINAPLKSLGAIPKIPLALTSEPGVKTNGSISKVIENGTAPKSTSKSLGTILKALPDTTKTDICTSPESLDSILDSLDMKTIDCVTIETSSTDLTTASKMSIVTKEPSKAKTVKTEPIDIKSSTSKFSEEISELKKTSPFNLLNRKLSTESAPASSNFSYLLKGNSSPSNTVDDQASLSALITGKKPVLSSIQKSPTTDISSLHNKPSKYDDSSLTVAEKLALLKSELRAVNTANLGGVKIPTLEHEPKSSSLRDDYLQKNEEDFLPLVLPNSPAKKVVKPFIRPMLPIQKSNTVNVTKGEIAAKLPPPPPRSSPQTMPGKKLLKKALKGKAETISLTLPISRNSTLDDLSKMSSRESSYVSRSPSPYSSRSSSVFSTCDSGRSTRSSTPRRVYPQSFDDNSSLNLHEYFQMEQSPVVYDANLSFIMGCGKQPVRQTLRISPAHSEKSTASNHLTDKIDQFLKRTDHVMDEWKSIGKKSKYDDDLMDVKRGTYRSKSVSNIMIKGFQLLKEQPPTSRCSSRQSSMSRDWDFDLDDDDNVTIIDDSELSEMTAELAEEQSSSNLIGERLEAETTERLRLEKDMKEHEGKYRNLQESSEKLEMELLCAKSDLNGDLDDDDHENDDNRDNIYRLKYERVARELEFTKKRLQTQHEHDLEQLIGLKKQLEKKLSDAYEEVEEQRQVVGQWKRKAQKMTNEMNDLRMLLEEQNSRNNLLEKKQRKFDSECQALQDSARQEKQAKERLAREKDVFIAEKFTLEQNLSDTRLELELKEEKYAALQRELEEMTFGGGTEEEIAQLKRSKMDLDRRCKEQEEELDEMAGQIQLLEQAKLRLEMSLETMRKEARKEAQQRDDEIEEIRGSSYKKIKTLECQLETEHEERTLLLREKHELERRLNTLEENERHERAAEEAASQKMKRDLRKYKALLRDAQTQLERAKSDSAGKALIRQLRNQLEDAEAARNVSVKARQTAESELQDNQLMLEEAQRARYEAEEKATSAQRDRTELQAQIDENEEEMAELLKKYSATVKQLNSEQSNISEFEIKISELESEKKSLKEQIAELTARLENVESIGDSSTSIQNKRLELRTKELESRLEFEQTTRARIEVQLTRHKDAVEKAQTEICQLRSKELQAQDSLKKSQKSLRELREELHSTSNKEQEGLSKRKDLEKRLETVEAEAASARADLRLALQRIADLQQAMEEGDSYHSDSEQSESSIDSMSELHYRGTSSSLSDYSRKLRSSESNGTDNTTLCIREEKENTPRITLTTAASKSAKVSKLTNGDGEGSESSFA